MSHAKLYSISAIAKLLDLPESTLHYWKNRFDQLLPSVGQGRHRRFRAEAVDIFRSIGNLLGSGLSVADAKAELSKTLPVNITPDETAVVTPVQFRGMGQVDQGCGEELAMRIGTAMAEAIGEKLQGLLTQAGGQPGQMALPDETVDALKAELARARSEIEELRLSKDEMQGKLTVLEAELIRLRKDGREMEKHLLGKIKAAQQA
ncbi:MAG: MerR family transcriptional regulator [Desulfovibrio sp.]|nr:MerR family transcriptional regulator [Desulfovibrio sp.]MBI4959795.1 MerR family transcriptional regulator [Desulfovibrio sp.]